MCPPVSVRPSREGVSHLHAAWLYQLQHGDQVRICFACFKLVFQSFRESLESEDWDDEGWNAELPEGAGWGQGLGPPAQGASGGWGSDTLAPSPNEPEGVGLDQYLVPTELSAQDATPLGQGPEDGDWTQGLPWRFGEVPTCCHWPTPHLLWQTFLKETVPPGEPMLLELVATQEVDPAEAEAWLLGLQIMSSVGGSDATFLRNMTARWARRTLGHGWKMLLEPNDECVVSLYNSLQVQELNQLKLSVLEIPGAGCGVELVPADRVLLRKGFSILSYSPWKEQEAEEGGSASGPKPSTQEPGPSVSGTCSTRPGETAEGPGPGGAAWFPAPPPEWPNWPVLSRLPQDTKAEKD